MIEPPTVVSAAFAASGSTQLYVAAQSRGLYSSPDGGSTWNVQESGPPDAAAVSAAPGDPLVAYAYELGSSGGIYRTHDGGVTWQRAGLVGGGGPVVVDPTDSNIAYAHVNGGDIERTTNGGASWSSVPLPDVGGVLSLAIDPSGTDVYAGTQGSLYKAPVAGGSWTTVSMSLGCAVLAIAFDRANASVIFAAGADCTSPGTPATVWRSIDSGAHFPVVATAFGAPHFSAVAVDSTGQHVVVAAPSVTGVLYSSDGGATFTAVSSPPDVEAQPASVVAVDGSAGRFLMGTGEGVAESDDNGQTWNTADLGLGTFPALSVVTSPLDDKTLYAGSWDHGIARSSVSGGSLQTGWLRTAPPPWDVESMAVDSKGTTVYAGTGNGVWISTDSGADWVESTQLNGGEVAAMAADPSQPGTVYAAIYGATVIVGGLWRSTDSGSSWQRIDAGLDRHTFTALAITVHPHEIWLAIDGEGVTVSSAQTINWGPAGGSQRTDALAVDPEGSVFAGACTNTGGVLYRSSASGWSRLDAGLNASCVTGLATDPTVINLVYASTLADGVFVSNNGGTSWSPMDSGLPSGPLVGIALNDDGTLAHVAGLNGVFDYQFSADIWSGVQATPTTLNPGQPIALTAIFGNDGPDDATSVTAVLTLPGDATAPPLSDTQHDLHCSGGHVDVCTAGILPAGATFGLTLQITAGAVGTYTASTSVASGRFDPVPRDANASVALVVNAAPVGSTSPNHDTTPPGNLRFVDPTNRANPLTHRFQRTTSMVLGWASDDPGATTTYDVRVRTAPRAGRFGDYTMWQHATTRTGATYRGAAGSTACFQLRAGDAAGNTSPWTADSCTAFPVPATRLIWHGAWRHVRAAKEPSGTLLATTTRGAWLVLTGVHAHRIALFVDRCPGCGELAVSLGGARLAIVNLSSARAVRGALVQLAPTHRHGSLEITVVTSNRPVRIDAIGLSAT